jgi:hypothetical protein
MRGHTENIKYGRFADPLEVIGKNESKYSENIPVILGDRKIAANITSIGPKN